MITWEQGAYSTESGSAGGVGLFGISYRTQRDTPAWIMRSSLPGLASKQWRDDDKDVLKALAERVLEQWLSRIGVTGKAAQ